MKPVHEAILEEEASYRMARDRNRTLSASRNIRSAMDSLPINHPAHIKLEEALRLINNE